MARKFIGILLIIVALSNVETVIAYDVGAAMTFSEDPDDVWYNSVKQFVEIIANEPAWFQHFLRDYPRVGPYMWTEEEKGGDDNDYADWTELSLVLGHGCVVVYPDGTKKSAIGFADKGCAIPDDIRLGYSSPDGYGYSVWTFIIQCSILEDEYVTDWLQTLQGIHMVLGFASTATISNADFPELAYRLTGTGGYSKEKVENAFFSTFLKADGVHDNNRARIIAENSDVLENDYLDSFKKVPVDGKKIIVTGWVGEIDAKVHRCNADRCNSMWTILSTGYFRIRTIQAYRFRKGVSTSTRNLLQPSERKRGGGEGQKSLPVHD